jgi:hypothetical protein
MFAATYLRTTDPETSYASLLAPDVGLSVLWHSVAYTLVFTLLTSVASLYIFLCLVPVMLAGYFARLARSKQLHRLLGMSERARRLMDSAYFTWYFLG